MLLAQDKHPEKRDSALFGRSMIAVIIGIIVILVIFLLVTTMSTNPGNSVPPATCEAKISTYVNNNLVQPGTTASITSISENKGMYELKGQYQSQAVILYTTKDCSLLFTSVIEMNATPAVPEVSQSPVKTDRPVADLYVMSFCPYGTQAETVMRPVVDLLGEKADIHIRYITTINGTTADSIQSLHGPFEAKEDLRQVCVRKNYPEKLWDYIGSFNSQCYPVWQNATSLLSCQKNATAALGMDNNKIEGCAEGADGIAVLKSDETAADNKGVTGSPTLIVNGVTYTGARTPEGYKQAICESFTITPSACNTTLSTATASSTGACS